MRRALDIFSSTIASTVRSWRGTSTGKQRQQPKEQLVLFDREGCSECRFVREALTELDLNAMIAPCPIGGQNIHKLKRESGTEQLPLLVDPNTGKKLYGRMPIISYLFDEYRGTPVPKQLADSWLNNTASKAASLIRRNVGTHARPAKPAAQALTLYSFESSPYSRPVRELLCELELPYLLVNLGKQQWADMGPAKFRFSLKPYQPIPNSKRDAFFKVHGNVQVPYLVDPNTNTQLFESKEILNYLQKTYGLG